MLETHATIAVYSARELDAKIDGVSAVELRAPLRDPSQPQILSVTLLPSRGFNLFQFSAHLPGRGEVELMTARPLKTGENELGPESEDQNGNLSFKEGGALLIPYANRIRGVLSKDQATMTTEIAGQTFSLPANWQGKESAAEKHAMHGLILNQRVSNLHLASEASEAVATASLEAGNFGGHWPSKTRLDFRVTLSQTGFKLSVKSTNVGEERLPIGVGWHPYFQLPSGDRSQACLFIPARTRLLVNNYDDVFPTGETEAVRGSTLDVAQQDGLPLAAHYLDDCFTDLERGTHGEVVCEIRDPAAHYGLRVIGRSPEIRAFQVYAPPAKNFIALEPQFNLADPYNHRIWGPEVNTGMVSLEPGASVDYEVELQPFTI